MGVLGVGEREDIRFFIHCMVHQRMTDDSQFQKFFGYGTKL